MFSTNQPISFGKAHANSNTSIVQHFPQRQTQPSWWLYWCYLSPSQLHLNQHQKLSTFGKAPPFSLPLFNSPPKHKSSDAHEVGCVLRSRRHAKSGSWGPNTFPTANQSHLCAFRRRKGGLFSSKTLSSFAKQHTILPLLLLLTGEEWGGWHPSHTCTSSFRSSCYM